MHRAPSADPDVKPLDEQSEVERLKRELKKVTEERDIFKKAGVLRQGCAVKYAWLDGQSRHYPLPALRDTLAVSMSGYRAWKRGGGRSGRRLTDAQLLELIRGDPRPV